MNNENITFPPKMDKVFKLLSSGYHVCIEDGDTYSDLTKNEKFYRKMFGLMGFVLSDGTESIYYFKTSDEKINGLSKKFMVFMAIMYDWLADQGREPVSSLIESHFSIEQLPHLSVEQYKKTMAQIEVDSEAELQKIVHKLKDYGFLNVIGNSTIKFRKTVSRFVSIFKDIADIRDHDQDNDEDSISE